MGGTRKGGEMALFLTGVVFTLLIIGYIIAFSRLAYLNEMESMELEKSVKEEK